jgi:predicted ATPase
MDEDRWRQLSALLGGALELRGEARTAFMRDVVPAELRGEVESLLAASETAGPLDRLEAGMDALRSAALASTRFSSGPAEGAGAEIAAGLRPGQRLGRHEIRARVGAGGMGEVYRAFDTRLAREVAVKVLGRRVLERPDARSRFEQEARAASALNHPNIITVHDIGDEQSLPYIVMELIDGESLRQLLCAGPCPVELLLHLAIQISDGIVAAHERQIVHGDLKPENILLNRQRVAKIVDFGLARFRVDDPPATSATRIALQGTPGYLAPELLAGRPADARCDQFSLGAIFYEMAAGARAFQGRTPLEMLERALHADPRPLSEVRPDLPPRFVAAVARCLRKAPDERHPSTRALLDELRAARRGPLASGRAAAPQRDAALPAPRTRLIGRRREMLDLERLIVAGEVRLLTLTGAGGTGKTRLALELAAALAPRFAGGVFFVPLGAIADAALVPAVIAKAMDAVVTPARPPLVGVIRDLRDAGGPTLLVLDNFEQVVAAAPTVSELLAACPDLAILVTSRETLSLYGEHGYPVAPLELADAVTLFVERAQAANAAFRLTEDNETSVVQLCAGLDGLPLATELAAAHSRVLTPQAMLARLQNRLALLTGGARDLPSRQQTLRRTIDWSHQLLSPTEQAMFRRLAVFAGGFTVEAAQAAVDPYATLDAPLEEGIAALVNKSLLQLRPPLEGEPRFAMLETLREYALEKLLQSGEANAAHRAHAAYFLVLAEEGGAALAAKGISPWLKRFEVEHDNLRVAQDSLTRLGNVEWGLRLALALFHFWERGEHLAEGRRRLEALLAADATAAFPAQRARALFAAGVLASIQGDLDRGLDLHRQCRDLYRALGDRRGVGVALVALGNQHAGAGAYDEARRFLEQSLEVWAELGDRAVLARSLSNLAFVARWQRRHEESRALYQQAAALFEAVGDRLSGAWALDHQGDVAREQDDLSAAEALYAQALDSFRALDDGWGIGSSLADLGAVARPRGDRPAAAAHYRDALASFVKLDHRRGIARLLECFACLAADEDRAERALQLAGAAAVLRERAGVPPAPVGREEIDRCLAAMHRRLGAAARSVWEQGARLSLDDAVQLAAAPLQ